MIERNHKTNKALLFIQILVPSCLPIYFDIELAFARDSSTNNSNRHYVFQDSGTKNGYLVEEYEYVFATWWPLSANIMKTETIFGWTVNKKSQTSSFIQLFNRRRMILVWKLHALLVFQSSAIRTMWHYLSTCLFSKHEPNALK